VSEAFASSPARINMLLSTNALERERIVVPAFQRGYMWKKKHVEAFWEDVARQRKHTAEDKAADPHFFGPIVTMAKPDEGIIHLLDGQQRLATATILFSVLRDLARQISKATGTKAGNDFAALLQAQFIRDENGLYSLEMGDLDVTYFKDTIQRDEDEASGTKAKQATHRNIKVAREVLYEKVLAAIGEKISDKMDAAKAVQLLKDYKMTVTHDLVMARIPVTSQEAAFRIFATLNDRGLRLSPPDLLLAFLMEKAPDNERKDIRSIWTEMVQKMGAHDIEAFLRALWVSRYGDLKEDLFTALKKYIEDNKIASRDFARLCGDECDDYIHLVTADDQIPLASRELVRAIARDLGSRAAVPLLLSSYLLLQPADFERTCRFMLVFITRYSIIGNKDSAGMENLFFRLAREVRGMVKDAEDSAGSQRAAKFVKEQLAANVPDDKAIKDAVISEATTLDAADARYVVTRLARFMQDPEKQVTLGETNVEHIYPQNPDANEWGGPDNQERLEPLTWHLGNLTIFGKRANRKAANAEYAIKHPRFQDSKVVMTAEIAKQYDHWDEKTIIDRAGKLAKLVTQIWNFDNPSRV
jgi:pyrimidine operon attenuation protein/uracil phosphoribosyltransferase